MILAQSRLNVADKTINEEEGEEELAKVRWSNVIFIPFHPLFKLIVLLSVITKTTLAPIQAVFPHVICTDLLDDDDYMFHLKYFYLYICDIIYGVDTFLHIVHRQVIEQAMRKEFLPKSALLLILDMLSLIPFYRLMSTESCPAAHFYPNIFAFAECIVIYRVVEYFDWRRTHSMGMTILCFTLLSALIINIMTCFLLLLTVEGLCRNCNDGNIYDWRAFVYHRFNQTENYDLSTYIYGSSFILSFFVNTLVDELKPNTYAEFAITILFMIVGYLLYVFVLVPKIFAESVLSLRRICSFHPRVSRIIEETKRRNPSPNAHILVEKFYALIWKKRKGITSIPDIITELPRYLRIDIRQDLVWPVFYHSPTFRKTSQSFKRFLCDYIHLDYKLPGERFFAGPHCYTHLYYLKSGIVQIISADDSTSPLLSVSGGTIFGDVSFAIPPYNRRVIVRCLTYCEVFFIPRADILRSLNKFPEDRLLVFNLANQRMKHARSLYNCKQNVKGIDRSEDEGIAWLKRRWWEISDILSERKSDIKNRHKSELPPEEAPYHCAKYIGQVVLCTNVQLQRKSMFANVGFPWILLPQSSFGAAWNNIVIFTVYLVLIFYPPNLSRDIMPAWFLVMQHFVDLVYVCDIVVSLMTSLEHQESLSISFATVMFARFKRFHFILDVLSTVWIENLVIIMGIPKYAKISQFNRLIKVYMFFTTRYSTDWKMKKTPMANVVFLIALIHFCFSYVLGYFYYLIEEETPNLSAYYRFGTSICSKKNDPKNCDEKTRYVLEIAIAWTFELNFSEFVPSSFLDVGVGMFLSFVSYITFMITKLKFMAVLYLKLNDIDNYHCLVSNLKQHYKHHKLHNDLMRRLNRFLFCHWKYYHGMDVMHANLLKDEPYDIYWKLHGEKAVKLIGESPAFLGADPFLVRELAHIAKFLIVPKKTVLFMLGVRSKNVTWIANGTVKCEYHNENGNLIRTKRLPGQLLSFGTVFLQTASLRTFSAASDCEILYIKIKDFNKIIQRYPNEWAYITSCIDEFKPTFDQLYITYMSKYKDYQKNLRARVFHATTVSAFEPIPTEINSSSSIEALRVFKSVPASRFVKFWLLFRTLTVVVQITCSALQGGSGAVARGPLIFILTLCDFVCLTDIILKLCMAYYDGRGLVISDIRKCIVHYGTRGLIMDIMGLLPWHTIYTHVFSRIPNENEALLLNTISSFAHIYLVLGYFDYMADSPAANYAYILIAKWQVFTLLIMMGTSHYFISKCIAFDWNSQYELVNMQRLNDCWIPPYNKLYEKPTIPQLHILFAQSLNLAQCGLMRLNLGKFFVPRDRTGFGVAFISLGGIFWYLMSVSQTLLILKYRGNTRFEHGVIQLTKFLEAERVDEALIDRAECHFMYWWIRTKGLSVRSMIHERIGVVFRQDLSFYFYKRTFQTLNTLLRGGSDLEHELAGIQTQMYFLPKEDIMREMDLTPYVYIVHRGRVSITQNGNELAVLTKGAIFGQLQGSEVRPIRVSAQAQEHADVLRIPINLFQEAINDEVRRNIDLNFNSGQDFMTPENILQENPYNTVQFILRGRQTIWLPWMDHSIEAHSNKWYTRWLFSVWLVGPTMAAVLALIQKTLPADHKADYNWCLLLTDVLHLAHVISNFYTTRLVIEDNKCVHKYKRVNKLTQWGFFFDVASIFLPLVTTFNSNWNYQLARLLRLHLFCNFHSHFCRNFQVKMIPILLKIVIVLLMMHALTCGWMVIACRSELGPAFPLKSYPLPPHISVFIDHNEWVLPKDRVDGCPKLTRGFELRNKTVFGFVVPREWQADYILALAYVLVMHTRTNMDHMVAITIEQIYYKIVMTFILYMLEMWITGLTISAVYTKLRKLYLYDYQVDNLVTYLKHNGLSSDLLATVKKYTSQLWARQRGYWLPEITLQAPICLREDLFSELYMHHLEKPTIFHQLPPYFLRQLVARLQRVVIFPGKCIVREGDIHPCLYFIHEGEVEKWFTDESGESKMVSLLLTNGYFGLVPGLFPNIPFQFSYYTRTVVDFVYLKHAQWEDLLDGYPEVKANLMEAAAKLKHSFTNV